MNMHHRSNTPGEPDATLVNLSSILGISRFNPRHDDESDVSSLAASIGEVRLLQPLLVHESPGGLGYFVLAGGRRYRALRSIAGTAVADDPLVQVIVCEGTEAELREIALSANTMHKPLHPVDEFEAFVALQRAGFDEDRIAKDFGLTAQHVRQRLALGRLSPRLLAHWRAGEITAEIAKAFTVADNHDAQEAALDRLGLARVAASYPHVIKRELQADSRPGNSPEALYVGADAYKAAGGRLHRDLFDEETTFLAGALLDKLAREKLLHDGGDIAFEEGWGVVLLPKERDKGRFAPQVAEPDYLEEEQSRLDAIAEAMEDPDLDEQAEQSYEAERDEIERRALLRTIPEDERATMAILVDIDSSGQLYVQRAWQPENPSAEGEDEAPKNRRKKTSAADNPSSSGEGAEHGEAGGEPESKALRPILNETIEQAFADCISQRLDLAIGIALVALTRRPWHQFPGVMINDTTPNTRLNQHNNLLNILRASPTERALELLAETAYAEIEEAFCNIVAEHIDPVDETLSDLAPLARLVTGQGVDLARAFHMRFDRRSYLAGMAKPALAALAKELGVDIPAKPPKKEALLELVLTKAQELRWLPQPLAEWTAAGSDPFSHGEKVPAQQADEGEQPSLAEAMDAAITADEANSAAEPPKKRGRKPKAA